MKKFILLFVCFSALLYSTLAQENEYPEWKTCLEGKDITQIINSGDYLWLAASQNRELIQFEKATGNMVHHVFNDRITDIADAGDYFWLLTYHEEFISYPDKHITSQELLKFEKATGNIVSYNFDYYDSDRNHPISSIRCDNNGLPWIYAYGFNIFRMTENEDWVIVLPKKDDIVDDITSDICFVNDNVVWISRGKNLIKYKNDKAEIIEANGYILGLTLDNEGNIWTRICADRPSLKPAPGTIAKFDGSNWSSCYYSSLTLQILGISDNRTIWIHGSKGIEYPDNYFIKFDSKSWYKYEPKFYFRMRSHAVDKEGLIWIGTWDNGLIKSDGSNWNTYDDSNSGLPSNRVNTIFIDTDGTKWIGTEKGLVSFVENDSTSTNNSESNETVTAVNSKSNLQPKIELFPNPTHDYITIKVSQKFQISTVEILNIQGKTIKTLCVNNNPNRLDVSNLPNGIYFVRIHSEQNHILKKFVKQ